MKVIIKEKEFDYFSDYPDGWKFSSGDSFKFPLLLGNYKCFVKRFDKKKPENISGWDLLNNLKGKFESNLPRVYDIVSTEEKSKNVYYVFFEYLQGSTLDVLIAQNDDVDLRRITGDLFKALQSLHKHHFWFPDFTEKNIFLEENGKFLLIDTDSVQPFSEAPHNTLYGDKEYWVLVLDFFKEILSYKELKLSELNGAVLNYLQVIFLILRIKIAFIDKKYEYKSENLYNNLPLLLNNTDTGFKDLFEQALNKSVMADYLSWSDEVKDIIFLKIIDNRVEPSTEKDYPHIKFFEATTREEENVKSFSLNWEVENAANIEVHRNGTLYKKMGVEERSISINEFYDGKKKEVQYTLLVANSNGTVESEPLTITLTGDDSEPVIAIADTEPNTNESEEIFIKTENVEEQGKEDNQDKVKKKKVMRFMRAALVLSVFITIFIIMNILKQKVSIAIFKSEVSEGNTLLISGNNLPKDQNSVEVYFDKAKGDITKYSQQNIQVVVPEITGENRKLKVAVVIKGDTTYAAGDLTVIEGHKRDTASKPSDSSLNSGNKVVVKKRNDSTNTSSHNTANRNTRPEVGVQHRETVRPRTEVNIYDLLRVHASSAVGNNNVKITVSNRSKYKIDVINVAVSYLNNTGYEVKKENLSFQNVKAHSIATTIVSEPDNVKTVDAKIINASSTQFDKDSQQQ